MYYPTKSCHDVYEKNPHRSHGFRWSDEYDDYHSTCPGFEQDKIAGDALCTGNLDIHQDHYFVPVDKYTWWYCPGRTEPAFIWAIDHRNNGEPEVFSTEKKARDALKVCGPAHGCHITRRPNIEVWESVE